MKYKTILSKDGYLLNKKLFDNDELNNIRNQLTVEPVKFGVSFVSKKKEEEENLAFKVYRETEDYLILPKYFGLEKFGKPDKNKEVIGEKIKLNFKGEMRDVQKKILDEVIPALEKNDGGLMCLGCGAGKTVLALYIASYFKVKTLVIVHKSFLLNQWKERIEQFTDAKVGIIQRDKVDIDGKQIVIGMIQSIAKDKYDADIFRDFGLVIFDEAHHAPSKYFSNALPLISSKKTLALSATPKRSDKLEKVLFWYFGPMIYKNDLEENNTVLTKIYKYTIKHEKFVEKKQRFTGQVNRPGTISNLITIGRRNRFIIDCVEDILNEDNRKIIVLSERKEHLELLKKRLEERDLTYNNQKLKTGFYLGGMKQSKLDESAKADVIFGTYQMASEALDIKGLNTLVMGSARREIEQTIGRITRDPNSKVRPLVIDITDNLDSFINQSYSRRKFYRTNGFQIIYYEVEDNKIISEEDITITKNEGKTFSKVDPEVVEFIDI
jgi:superfamily II DNA or RNA helicase